MRIIPISRSIVAAAAALVSATAYGSSPCGPAIAGTWRLAVEFCTPVCAPGAQPLTFPCTADPVTFEIEQRGRDCDLLSVAGPVSQGLGRTNGETIEVNLDGGRLTASCGGESMERVVYEVGTRPPPPGGCGAIMRGPMTRVTARECGGKPTRRRACREYCAARAVQCARPARACRRSLRCLCRRDGLEACDPPVVELPPPTYPVIGGTWSFEPTSCTRRCFTPVAQPPESCDPVPSEITLFQYGDDCGLVTRGPQSRWLGLIESDRRTVTQSAPLPGGGGPRFTGVLADDRFMTDVNDFSGVVRLGLTGCETTQVGTMTRIGGGACHRSVFIDEPPLR